MAKITLDLKTGPNHSSNVTQNDIDKNIEALKRSIDCKSLSGDFSLLLDTISILEGIKEQLPNDEYILDPNRGLCFKLPCLDPDCRACHPWIKKESE